ncbi:MAG: Ldh family oxidoreductase [Candidatus Heimdallarchaeaceae archaeon]
MPLIHPQNLEKIIIEILKSVGVSDEKAKIVAGNLVRSDMRGIRSHGINHLGMYVEFVEKGIIYPASEPKIIRETSTAALIDGKMGFGQVVCKEAVEIAVKKAKKHGVGVVGIINCGHVGHLSDYTRMILDEGMIGIMLVNCDKGVAPYGGKDIVLGTNPISVAIPAGKEDPIIADFATSVTAGGYIALRLKKGEKMPEGWAIDSDGNSTTDPRDLFKDASLPIKWGDNFIGAILPAAGHKGYALALIVDVLAGALAGGKCNGDVIEGENGVFVQVINPEIFVSREEFEKRVDKLIRACKLSAPRPGFDKVLIPGDPEREAEKKSLKYGILVDEDLWNELLALGKKYGVDVKKIANL